MFGAAAYPLTTGSRISGQTLQVTGVVVDDIEVVELVRIEYSDLPISTQYSFVEVKRLYHQISSWGDPKPRSEMLEAMIYAVSVGQISDHLLDHSPARKSFSLFNLTKALDEVIQKDCEDLVVSIKESNFKNGAVDALRYHLTRLLDRCLARTRNGYLAVAPSEAKPGDVLVVMLDLSFVACLRPQRDGNYTFIGICTVHGLNWGEALVGAIPQGLRYLSDQRTGRAWEHAFLDGKDGTTSCMDPRVNWEELQVEKGDPASEFWGKDDAGTGYYFKLPDEEYLLRHGVKLQTLNIV